MIDWGKLSKDVLKYYFNSDDILSKIHMPMNASCCTNVNCVNSSHGERLCDLSKDIVIALLEASRSLFTHPRKAKKVRLGWNKFVASACRSQ